MSNRGLFLSAFVCFILFNAGCLYITPGGYPSYVDLHDRILELEDQDLVETKEILLIDDNGAVRASLGMDENGDPSLDFFDDSGDHRLELCFQESGTGLVIKGPRGERCVALIHGHSETGFIGDGHPGCMSALSLASINEESVIDIFVTEKPERVWIGSSEMVVRAYRDKEGKLVYKLLDLPGKETDECYSDESASAPEKP